MKQPPISTEAQKVEFIKPYEARFRATDLKTCGVLCFELAVAMKKAGLFRKSTYVVDIAGGIRKRVLKWKWVNRQVELP